MCSLIAVLGVSFSKLQNASFLSLSSSNVTLQAQQYAAMESERLRVTNYADLASKGKTKITNSNYFSEVTVGVESDYDSDTKQKECVINIYRLDEKLPRCTTKVVRLSKGGNGSGISSGMIVPWYGKLSNIPDGFALCDGTNGTPDLRDRFLVGIGNSYSLDDTGGMKL